MDDTFGRVLRDLLIEKGYTTKLGNPDWGRFVRRLPTVKYETLRKAVTGERLPSVKVMVETALALGVEADVFLEFRLYRAQVALDPREVGLDNAARALRQIENHQEGG